MLEGDATLSVRGDSAVQGWRVVEPFLQAWRAGDTRSTSTRRDPSALTPGTTSTADAVRAVRADGREDRGGPRHDPPVRLLVARRSVADREDHRRRPVHRPRSAGSDVRVEPVRYDHEGTALLGVLAKDHAESGPRPAVLVVHDWHGVNEHVEARVAMLARLGYVAFGADVYGEGVRPGDDTASEVAGSFYQDLPLFRARLTRGSTGSARTPTSTTRASS